MQPKIKILNRHSNLLGYKLFSISVKEFIKDDCFTLSLSISFVFLLSIIPFSTLSILIFNVLQNLSFSQTNWAGRITEMLADELIQIIPFVSKEWVKTHVINLEAYGSFKTINFLMLPIISGLIFKTLETSYRRIFRLPARHLLLGQVIYISMSIFAVLLFFILNFIWIILAASLPHLFTSVNKTPYFASLYETVRLCAAYQPIHLLSALILIMFYLATIRLFLNIKIRFRYRLFSGILFCLLWTFARKFFGIYIQHISEINVLYGSLSSVIVILMWVFYSAIALLFSIEVMFVLHSGNYRWRWW
jgi:YihY family inner membrane protein